MSLTKDLNSLIKTKKIKQPLVTLPTRKSIDSNKGVASDDDVIAMTIKPPLSLEILTYDDTKDVTFNDTGGTPYTLKTAATAKITDADGREFPIDTIEFEAPV